MPRGLRGAVRASFVLLLMLVCLTELSVVVMVLVTAIQWELGHKKPSTRNPTLESQGSYRFVVWEPMAFHCKTLRNEETQGTLEGSRVFLGMGSHCKATYPTPC